MAVPAIVGASASAGILAADVTVNSSSTISIIVGAITAVAVALIGAGIQVYLNRHRNRNAEPTLTPDVRLALLEAHVAEMQRALHDIETHIHPWPKDGRR